MSGKRKLVSGAARNDALQALLAAKEKGEKNKYDVNMIHHPFLFVLYNDQSTCVSHRLPPHHVHARI